MFHCGQCGTRFKAVKYPKECHNCGMTSYSNPNPVAVALVPVWKESTNTASKMPHLGILIGKRGIEPFVGEWALPGGFVEDDREETNEMAARRELFEETGIQLDLESFQLSHSRASGRGSLLTFVDYKKPIHIDRIQEFVACGECPEIDIAWKPQELCFSTHTEALRLWFESRSIINAA